MSNIEQKVQAEIAMTIGQQAIQIASLRAQLEAVTRELEAVKAKQGE